MPRELPPLAAADLVRSGALLIDIRETPEREAGTIPGAVHAPLSRLAELAIEAAPGRPVIFHCKAGGRTRLNAPALAQKAPDRETYLLEGGIEAWEAAGLPVDR